MSAWFVDELRLVAVLKVGLSVYEVDLLRARTREEALDWIHHIAGQQWATADIVRGLVDVLLVWNVKRIARASAANAVQRVTGRGTQSTRRDRHH
jgi:hypothetical protein